MKIVRLPYKNRVRFTYKYLTYIIMNYNNEFDNIVLNTKTMQVYIQIGTKKYSLRKLQTGENCIITTNKILENYKLVGNIKSFKYANIFNADNQKLINHYLNS